MAYTRITPCKHGKNALAYAMNGKGHNCNKKRYEYLGTVNMFLGIPLYEQMNKYWQRASDRNQTQVWRIVQSFSTNEFDPNNPEHIRTANECGQQFVKDHFPNRQAAIVTQIDGKSGLVHNHIILSNVDMVNNKGIDKEQRTHAYIMKHSDETLQRMGLELDYGKNHDETYTHAERTLNEQKKYVWKDDLKARIEEASKEAVDYDSFEDLLDLQGVGVVVKPKNITYTLNDLSKYLDEHEDKPKKPLKARGKNLGVNYDKQHLEELFERNKELQQYVNISIHNETNDTFEELEFTKDRTILETVQAPEEELEGSDYKFNTGKENENMKKIKTMERDVIDVRESIQKQKQREETHVKRVRALAQLSVLQNMRIKDNENDWQFGD